MTKMMSKSEASSDDQRHNQDKMRQMTYIDGIQDTLQGVLADIKQHPDAKHPEYIAGVALVTEAIANRQALAHDMRISG